MEWLADIGVIGTIAAVLGTLVQIRYALSRQSWRSGLEDGIAYDELLAGELAQLPRWRLIDRRRRRLEVKSELLSSDDRRILRHARWQTSGWVLVLFGGVYAAAASVGDTVGLY